MPRAVLAVPATVRRRDHPRPVSAYTRPSGVEARCYTRSTMPELLRSIFDQVRLTTLVDIAIVSLLIYGLFSLIRGTRAVRLVIGVSVLIVVYVLASALGLRLLTQILQGGAVVGCKFEQTRVLFPGV